MTDPSFAPRLQALRTRLRSVEPLHDANVTLPRSGRNVLITRPTDLDLLLDRAADDPEQNLPYWSEIWPSGVALADAILTRPELLAGRRTLELGGGLGITAIAALTAGADLTVTDYAPEAALLCRYNALRNTGREPATRRMNWRRPPAELVDPAGAGFPVVLAADVLYEARDVEPLLAIVDALVAADGMLWLAEPGRLVARRFLDAAAGRGWRSASSRHPGPWPDPKDDGVVVGIHLMRRAYGVSANRHPELVEGSASDERWPSAEPDASTCSEARHDGMGKRTLSPLVDHLL